MKKVLAPHKEQDGWVYARFPRKWLNIIRDYGYYAHPGPNFPRIAYEEWTPDNRLITSRRVERAVETDDFLRLCAEEGLAAVLDRARWTVYDSCISYTGGGATLREAYYRYHAAVNRD